jgi:hypothetical protein
VFVEGLDVSLGSFIGILAANSVIVDRKTRHFVTLGMNGILDMTDLTSGSQLDELSSESVNARNIYLVEGVCTMRISMSLKALNVALFRIY